ncbi:hypothetical protein Nepgr_026101 [Nepenthes gracilis]|uniref:F-box associated beta-propeller type 1 domain-containing protein n=1 Tax=Nepenthes gracilis TaxID=150966 RepID=A0AAD3T682_NEPGR|nr:hypothetical protein Nepgr_026101 [Nepenthes gracilis]
MAYPQFDRLDKTPPRVELYSVDWETWNEVPAGHIKYCILDFYWSQWFLKGAIHWLAYERGKDKDFQHNILQVFDVSSKNFMKMPLPLELAKANPARLVVSKTRCFLSVLHYELGLLNLNTRHCHIWVKKKYIMADSQSKVAQVDFGKGWSNILSLGANNRVLGTSDGKLVLCDIDGDMFYRLGVKVGMMDLMFVLMLKLWFCRTRIIQMSLSITSHQNCMIAMAAEIII